MTETTIPVQLDTTRAMVFNANTMAAFERETGKFFLDAVATLYEAYQEIREQRDKAELEEAALPKEQQRKAREARLQREFTTLVRRISVADIRAMVWAAVHDYDAEDEPHWPLTINKVGRLLTPATLLSIIPLIVRGQAENSPTKEELGESSGPLPPETAGGAVRPIKLNGGGGGIELDAAAFALPTGNSTD